MSLLQQTATPAVMPPPRVVMNGKRLEIQATVDFDGLQTSGHGVEVRRDFENTGMKEATN